eukprot:GHVU01227618.1.p1 GENE.GHVU01227618.1~~GHVU01227618.1.p1  ORF type:complete len:160 (-),score=11.06 GHVU01227618.1:540-1019(-)
MSGTRLTELIGDMAQTLLDANYKPRAIMALRGSFVQRSTLVGAPFSASSSSSCSSSPVFLLSLPLLPFLPPSLPCRTPHYLLFLLRRLISSYTLVPHLILLVSLFLLLIFSLSRFLLLALLLLLPLLHSLHARSGRQTGRQPRPVIPFPPPLLRSFLSL